MKTLLTAALAATVLALAGCAAQHDASMSGTLTEAHQKGSIGSIAVLPAGNANKIGRFAYLINNTLVDSLALKNAELQILGPYASTTTLLAEHAASEASGLVRGYFADGTVDAAALAPVRAAVGTDAIYIMRFDEIVEEGAEGPDDRGISTLKTRSAIIDLRSGAVVWTGDTYVSRETERGQSDPELVLVMEETVDKIIEIMPTL